MAPDFFRLVFWVSYSRRSWLGTFCGDVDRICLNVDANGTDHVHSTETDTESCRDADKWDADKRAVCQSVSIPSI